MVSVSALSDRGVKPRPTSQSSTLSTGFSIRSFGSWGEALQNSDFDGDFGRFSIRSFGSWGEAGLPVSFVRELYRFSIRSFGSWGEAQVGAGVAHHHHLFQYPLFRIVG